MESRPAAQGPPDRAGLFPASFDQRVPLQRFKRLAAVRDRLAGQTTLPVASDDAAKKERTGVRSSGHVRSPRRKLLALTPRLRAGANVPVLQVQISPCRAAVTGLPLSHQAEGPMRDRVR